MKVARLSGESGGGHARGVPYAAVVIAVLAVGGCAKPAEVIESGALLVRIRTPGDAPMPDELRVSIYDDGGVVFKNARIPERGAIVPPAAGAPLGTILVQPGVSHGLIRVHVRGLANGARILDGMGRVPTDARQRGVFDLVLAPKVPYDDDLDDVPDAIDDCLNQPDPEQTGCVGADAGADTAVDVAAPVDAPGAGAGGGGAGAGGQGGGGGVGVGGVGGVDNLGESAGSGGQGPATGGATGGMTGGGDTGSQGTGGGASGGGVSGGGGAGTGGRAVTGTGGTQPGDGGAADAPRPVDGGTADAVRKALGAACVASSECASAFCVDKFCCQTACNQPCQVCGRTGACTAVSRVRDVPECAGTNICNASAKCVAE